MIVAANQEIIISSTLFFAIGIQDREECCGKFSSKLNSLGNKEL